jgi:hypothetical protein
MICVGFRCVEQLLDVHVKINRIARAFICDPNDVANANGGLQPQQEQQMADVDHLMYELICINAPEKAMALLTQPAPMQTTHASSMSLNALGFDDLTRPSFHPAAETEQYIQANTPYFRTSHLRGEFKLCMKLLIRWLPKRIISVVSADLSRC